MKLTSKIQIGFALPAVFLIGLGGFSLWGFNKINYQIGTIYDDRVIPLQQLKNINDQYGFSIIDTVNKTHGSLMTNSEALQEIQLATKTIEEQWQLYRQTTLTPEERILADQIEPLFVAANSEIEKLRQTLENYQGEELISQLDYFDGPLYAVLDPITEKIDELSQLQLDVARQERELAREIVTGIYWLFIPILLLTVLALLPIRALISKAILSALTDTINNIAAISTEIATASEEQQRIAEQQAVSVTKTTTTMDELDSSAQQSAQQAETAASGAQRVLELSQQGDQAVSETIQGMSELKERVLNIAVSMNQLNEQIKQIDLYQKLVSEIASQTNMLALNAAVEAVRAGDHGKGFSVVATEIRKLADQSKDSAQKINHLIGEIQTALKTTIQATESGTQTVEKGVKVTEITAKTFQDVVEAIDNVATSSKQISLTAKQQAIAITQVVNTMSSLNQGAIETATGINQTKSGIERLNNTALRLKAMV
jgi:methyl-accepting chemotaxis protein